LAATYLVLIGILPLSGPLTMVTFFFTVSVLSAGFGVADTQALFGLAPQNALPHLVIADVASSLLYGTVPLAAGVLLDLVLSSGVPPVAAYRMVFIAAAVMTLLSMIPLRRLGR
jgi:hypothetical protein